MFTARKRFMVVFRWLNTTDRHGTFRVFWQTLLSGWECTIFPFSPTNEGGRYVIGFRKSTRNFDYYCWTHPSSMEFIFCQDFNTMKYTGISTRTKSNRENQPFEKFRSSVIIYRQTKTSLTAAGIWWGWIFFSDGEKNEGNYGNKPLTDAAVEVRDT